MLFIIVTCRSLFWILSSIGTFMLAFSAIFLPRWLVSEQKEYVNRRTNATYSYRNTIGIYNKCEFSRGFKEVYCRPYASSLSQVTSVAWQCCLFFLGLALLILGIASLLAVLSLCKQVFLRKSLMNLAGILQTIAGIFLIVVIILYPLGWDNGNIQKICHEDADKAGKFQIGSCSIGISFFCAIGAMVACFFCGLTSFVADKAVFSSKVQDEILEGKRLICVF